MIKKDSFSSFEENSLSSYELNLIRGGGKVGSGTTNDGSLPNVGEHVLYPDCI
jgi:natural product precursor